MNIKDEITKIENEIKDIHKKSFAMEMMEFQKEQNGDLRKNSRRLFIIWFITFIALVGVSVYTIYLIKDNSKIVDEKIVDIQDVETIDNSHIKISDDVWEKLG